jgi:small subunit ribosomal protein S8
MLERNISRLKNAQKSYKSEVVLVNSKSTLGVLKILREEGFIRGFSLKPTYIRVFLKYMNKYMALNNIFLVSKPSRRVYFSFDDLIKKNAKKGFFILSTSQGLLPSNLALDQGLGGEVLLFVN